MKIACYSDLHFEFGHEFRVPRDVDADVLVLAGDIISFRDVRALSGFLVGWEKPVVYVAGNHEYYHGEMRTGRMTFREWVRAQLPHVRFLDNESAVIDGVRFFGGTMWTDFGGSEEMSMNYAEWRMNDFRCIRDGGELFSAKRSVELHALFREALERWLVDVVGQPSVIVTHHVPVRNPDTIHADSQLRHAFVCTDMQELVLKYSPSAWVYGHSHECGRHSLGKTRFVLNQSGYYDKITGGFECSSFDPGGAVFEV